jgi:EAL domain-containing protein (putative c-di-GMP-specific phosphodiesterase class I)
METIQCNESLREIKDIIQDKLLNILFQPVVSLKNAEVLGYQILGKGPENTQFCDTQLLYENAKKYNLTLELKLACRMKAIEKIKEKQMRPCFFIDLPMDMISDIEYIFLSNIEQLSRYNIYPGELVFEVTENTSMKDYKELKDFFSKHLQKSYIKVLNSAISKHHNNLLSHAYPYIIKIRASLIKDIDSNRYKQELLKMIKEIADMDGLKIIAEGIHTENQLKELIKQGIQYGCGNIIKSPVEEIKPISNEAAKLIKDINRKDDRLKEEGLDNCYIGLLAEKDRPLCLETSIDEVNEIFSQHYYLQGIPVVKNDIPVGLIMRNKFYFQLLRKKSEDINKKSVKTIMTKLPLIVDYYAPVNKVIKLAISRREECIYDYIIVSQNSKYYGVVSIAKILEAIEKVYN